MDHKLRSTFFILAGLLRGSFEIVDIVEQFSILLFLKMLDDATLDSIFFSADTGHRFTHWVNNVGPLFPMQAERYRWRNWSTKRSGEVRDYVNEEVIPYISSLIKENATVAAFFKGARIGVDDSMIDEVVGIIDRINFSEILSTEGDSLLEGVLDFLESATHTGPQYRTSPAIRKIMIDLVDLQAGDTVYDPACGTGGLLGDAIDRLKVIEKAHDSVKSRDTSVTAVTGIDISRQMARIATINLALHGAFNSSITRADALENKWGFLQNDQSRYDVVLVDPPFDGRYLSN